MLGKVAKGKSLTARPIERAITELSSAEGGEEEEDVVIVVVMAGAGSIVGGGRARRGAFPSPFSFNVGGIVVVLFKEGCVLGLVIPLLSVTPVSSMCSICSICSLRTGKV